jgi:catechol 2,3-dioxygenase-like lactoylglutathione lyase family enzyme
VGDFVKILQNHDVLAVHNARESARFYADVLGFHVVHEDPSWIFVARDKFMVMLGECPDDMHPSHLGCHNYFAYLRVDDVDAFHAQLQAKGVQPLDLVEDKSWGMREFGIKTPDGHRITVGEEITVQHKKAGRPDRRLQPTKGLRPVKDALEARLRG